MILVAVGGVKEHKFERLLRILDELCDEHVINGDELVAQVGFNDYTPRNYKYFDFIGNEEFKNMARSAQFMITHAGTGTVVSAVKDHVKVIIFPRLSEYNEHLDDHQLELSNLFENKGYALVAKNKEELVDCINRISEFTPSEYISNNEKITQLIINCIEGI